MTDEEARKFGRTKISFGSYVGWEIDRIPLGYLIWLDGESYESSRELNRYLRSPRIRREIDA
jgi:uncharacterized protein (DUF3820 family)